METQSKGWSQDFRDPHMAFNEDINKAMKDLIIRKKPVDESVFLDEYYSTMTAAGVIKFQLQIDRPALIERILYSFNPAAAGTLAIGDRVVGFPSSVKVPDTLDVAMIVLPKDYIVLTVAGATSMFIEVFGKVLVGTEWSQV